MAKFQLMLLVALTYVCGMMAVPVAQVEPLAAEVQPLEPVAVQPLDDLEVAGQFHHHHHGHGGFGGFGGGFGGFGGHRGFGGFGHRHHHHHHGLFPGLFNPFFF